MALLKGLPAEYDTVKQMMREKKPDLVKHGISQTHSKEKGV